MKMKTVLCSLGSCLLIASVAAAQESPNNSQKMVTDVLNNVRQRADEQKMADRKQALSYLEQARSARSEGRIADAVRLTEKAQFLFPESPAVRQMLKDLRGESLDVREQGLNLTVAKSRLEEALTQAEQLMRDKKFAAAKDLAETARDLAGKFPQGVDGAQLIQAAEKILHELPAAEATTPRELLPAPEPAPREPPKTPSAVRQVLAKKIDREWRDAPLAQVLQDLAKETGLNIAIDPDLQAGRVFETRRVYLQAHGSTAERVLRTVTDLTLSAYVLADGEVQILPKHKAALYTVARSREVPEVGLRSAEVRPLPPARYVPPLLPGELEKLPAPAPAQSMEYLQSGQALRAEVERLLRPAKPTGEEP